MEINPRDLGTLVFNLRDWFSGAGLPKASHADSGNTAVMHIKTADGVEVVDLRFS